MKPDSVLAKTAKGLAAANGDSALSGRAVELLSAIDGRRDLKTLRRQTGRLTARDVEDGIDELLRGGYIQLLGQPTPLPDQAAAEDNPALLLSLDFSALRTQALNYAAQIAKINARAVEDTGNVVEADVSAATTDLARAAQARLEAEVRSMLVTALRPRVEEALRVKLAAALRPKIVDELRRTLAAALRPRLEAAVRAQLEADLRPRIELELRTRFEQQFADMQTQAKSRAPQAVAPASGSASSASDDDDTANRVFACLGEAAFATDAHGMLTRVNTAWTQLSRRTDDACIGKALADFFVEEDRRGVAGFLSRVAQGTAISLVYEGQLERGDGETLWIELRAAPLASTSGEAAGACGVLRDIGDARRAAAEHEDASLQLLLMVDETDAGVLIEDIDGTIKQVNPAFCALFGVQAAPFSLEGSASAELIQELGFSFADVDELLTLMARIRGAAEDVDGCDIRLSGRRVARLSYRAVAEDGPPRGHLWIFRLATPAVSTENP